MNTQIQDKGFPRELLATSIETRLQYFMDKKINHPKLDSARRQALQMLGYQTGPDILIITGPTGVGKTTLADKIWESLLGEHREAMEQDRNLMPVVKISATAPNQGVFNWKDFYIRLLRAYDETLIRQKTLFPMDAYRYIDVPQGKAGSHNVTDALRRASEICIYERRTRFLLIDEAQHIIMAAKGGRLREQFEAIKSLSINTQATIVLIGTYDLLTILEQGAQLGRRSRVVPFHRYMDDINEDVGAFQSALYTFQQHMPFEIVPDLVSHAKEFYLKTAGCIGILKDWLNMVVENGLKDGLKTVDREYANKLSLKNLTIKTVFEEAITGENKLADVDIGELESYVRDLSKSRRIITSSSERTPAKAGRRPGKRKPLRDPVGFERELFGEA